jgi:hypothetical protein
MTARRILTTTYVALAAMALLAPAASAQFTPRFRTREAGPPVQWHIGAGASVINLGDYTSEIWPRLDTPSLTFHARLGVAIPLKGEKLFIIPELEGHLSTTTKGEYIHPLVPSLKYNIDEIWERGFSVMLNMVRSYRDRNVLMGGGVGFHLMEHDPVTVQQQRSDGVPFHQDPFNHIGIGVQFHYARGIKDFAAGKKLMAEARYKVAYLSGNASDRSLLMSEFQLTLYLAYKQER